jgi:hypothetical protein
MKPLFVHIDALAEPLNRLDALMNLLNDYVVHPLDDIDPTHAAYTLLMMLGLLDEIKAAHEGLYAFEKAGRLGTPVRAKVQRVA